MLTTRSKGESLDSNKKQKILQLLGLAQRANCLVSGEEFVVEAIRKGQAKLVFLANDAAHNLSKKVSDKSQSYQVDVVTAFSTLELSTAVGKSRKAIALTDAGFTKKMRSIME
ncbi:YlxQ-related RNA-binding protein [Streptococcus cameli]